jgi:NitT/TauT family transport system substrate-binding protein
MRHVKPLLLAAALLTPAGAIAQELTTVNVIMPLPRSANFYPLIAGEALGYFAEEGVQVNLLPSSTSIPYVAFVQNGQSDLSMLDHSEVINAAAAGAEIAVVYEVMQNAPEGLAVLADSPTQTVADLKGTTVGLVSDRDRNTLAIGLGTAGLSIDDVSTVVVGEGGPVQANALSSGSVSAISGAVPDWLALQAAGMQIRMITPEDVSKVPANNFVINKARAEELRGPIQGFLRAWSKGMHVATVDPDALAEMCKKAVPEEWENETFGRQFLDASIPMNVSITEKAGDPQDQVWKDIQPRMLKVGAIEQEIDPATFLDDSFIAFANDWSRDEVKAEVAAWREANMK